MPRFLNIFIALVGLLLASPLFLAIVILIRIGSKGPIFFGGTRVGLGTQEFQQLKFRSMVPDAHKIGSFQTDVNDPRITPIGAFLRKSSLDELPQLINVLKGDMNLVGPRPDNPVQKKGYTQEAWLKRHTVRPGITGLAQANGRNWLTAEQRTQLDLEYVDTRSFLLDMKIIFQTIRQILFERSF